MVRVLLIEDDSTAATGITMTLRAESYVVDTTDLGEDGLEIAKLYDYDIILLDLMLPDIDGYEVLRRLRASRVRTPVLVLSGLGVNEPNSRTRGLNLGADDFLTKPFHPRELIARMQTIIRRTRGHSESTIRTGRMTVNLDRRVVEIDGRLLPLPDKEYRVLELLCLRKGKTLTKEMFLSHLYGGRDEPDSKIIDVYVCKLRKKLKDATGDSHIIETIWGRGYLLREPASVVA